LKNAIGRVGHLLQTLDKVTEQRGTGGRRRLATKGLHKVFGTVSNKNPQQEQ